ncbi:MAG: hypothetical protein ACRD1R_18245 [Acidobacteriota bacterium]
MEAEFRILPVELSDDDVALRAEKMACYVEERDDELLNIEELKEQTKVAVKTMESAVAKFDKQISELAEIVRTHHEKQEVECEWDRNENVDPPLMELLRLDTREVVESRPMTAQERQRGLFGLSPTPRGESFTVRIGFARSPPSVGALQRPGGRNRSEYVGCGLIRSGGESESEGAQMTIPEKAIEVLRLTAEGRKLHAADLAVIERAIAGGARAADLDALDALLEIARRGCVTATHKKKGLYESR